MPISLGSTDLTNLRVGAVTPDRIFLGNSLVWPAYTETTQIFATVGSSVYDIPANCRFIDIVLLGGGGGGAGGNNANGDGQGGKPSVFVTRTLVRGIDIPWSVTQITVTVGAGGSAGAGGVGSGGPGGTTSVSTVTGFTLSSVGGTGGVGINPFQGTTPIGDGVLPVTFNGILYQGGASVGSANPSGVGAAGNPPGGGAGGGGGNIIVQGNPGGAGGRGQAWIRAY
ncbi:hypothetical protein SEA_LOKK_9 [Mycobacterium phage Lokk]|nr:hypothetical protein SEA_LOKK_9 [Mycobacterium phage Lokk]QDF18405.1 hypothetical protein SEA_RACHALY_9 [Mycobacterium Phage Rachaly]